MTNSNPLSSAACATTTLSASRSFFDIERHRYWAGPAPALSSASTFIPQAAAPARPGQRRAAALAATAEGQAGLASGRRLVGQALLADGVAPFTALRLARGLSQQQLADAAGIQQPQLSRIENGAHDDLMLGTAQRLAQALGVEVGAIAEAFDLARQARRQPRAGDE